MKPFASFSEAQARAIEGVLTDIDGTLTDDGKLGPEAYEGLWRLQSAGLRVVVVTGRPAGWCDLIVRQWPVDAVVGENGALAMHLDGRVLREILHPDVAGPEAQRRLAEVQEAILAEVPGSRVARDQPYRRYDLAIDYREEPPDLGLEAAERIRAVFERHGAHAKVSDIHVNGWFGDYDKLAMMRTVAQTLWACDLEAERDRYVYCGDSPNDEPMFAYFPNACGVANVRDFEGRINAMPGYITRARGGEGFAEMAEQLLAKRQPNS